MKRSAALALVESSKRTKLMSSVTALAVFVCLAGLPPSLSAQGRFLRSVSDLADPRGYCLDIPGFGPRMQLDGPIATHSCKYSLPGFDVDEIVELRDDQLLLVNYDRCLAVDAMEAGSDIKPIPCEDAHRWQIHFDGRVTPLSSADFCMTLAPERIFVNSSPGTVPPYSMRHITLEPCSAVDAHLQRWRWAEPDERVTYNANSLRSDMPRYARARIEQIGPVIDPQATMAIYADAARAFGPADVIVSDDIAYGSNERHRLRVYEGVNRNPSGGTRGAPVILLVHGGGFRGGNLETLHHVATHFAGLGFVAVNMTYPLSPEHTWPSGAAAVAAAVDWVSENIGAYRGDAQRVYLMGHSAGGNHVANYVFRPSLSSGAIRVAGAILASPALELDPRAPADSYSHYFNVSARPWSEVRLLDNVEASSVPVLITVAQFDPEPFHLATAQLYAKLIGELGARPRIRQIPGHGHISYITAIGTGDRLFVEEALDFMLERW